MLHNHSGSTLRFDQNDNGKESKAANSLTPSGHHLLVFSRDSPEICACNVDYKDS